MHRTNKHIEKGEPMQKSKSGYFTLTLQAFGVFALIAPAHAQTGSIGGFDLMSMLPLVLIFVVFYFFLIRPQQKKSQQQRDLLSALRRGDRIVTSGGLIGVITKVVSDQELQVEIAENVRVRVARSMVADLLSKTEPAPDLPEVTASTEKKKPMTKPINRSMIKKAAPKKPTENKKGK